MRVITELADPHYDVRVIPWVAEVLMSCSKKPAIGETTAHAGAANQIAVPLLLVGLWYLGIDSHEVAGMSARRDV
jgi:uncharacterized membrane protein YfbV (UPF0208 family)